jgi:hypothetical protein
MSPNLSDAIKILLSANSASASTPNNIGYLPMHYLCESSNPSIESIRVIFQAHRNAVNFRNRPGRTPVDSIVSYWKQKQIFNSQRDITDSEMSSVQSFDSEQWKAELNKFQENENINYENEDDSYKSNLTELNLSNDKDQNFPTDNALVDLIRLLLRTCSPGSLTPEQESILREMNWQGRRVAILATFKSATPEHNILMHFRNAYQGIWRNLISFL